MDLLRLVARGCRPKRPLSNCISSRTTEFHKKAVMEKLKFRTTAQLTRYAIEKGIGS